MPEEAPDSGVNTGLGEPHFDDERTLLSAKPVVPLDRVKSESRSRTLMLTATITVAVVLGTFGARFIYNKRAVAFTDQHTLPDVTSGVSGAYEELPQAQEVLSGDEEAGLEKPASLDEPADVKPHVPQNSRPRLQKAKATRENHAPQTDSAETTDEPSVSRRISRWEERRERRARRRDARSRSDLQRIDQIFEGTPKP
jgi:hypothetical protein